jgi:uncharacterized protein (DUF1697 family)
MNTYIVLLKGINVGGHKKVPMIELRELLTKSGFQNVKTYIQSGNVIIETSKKNSQKIDEVSVLAKTRKELERIFNDSPFSEEEKKKSYFIMLQDMPNSDLVKVASGKVYEEEQYQIINDCIYYYSAKGFGQSKFNANYFERKLNTFATARNYNTMVKLLSLSS